MLMRNELVGLGRRTMALIVDIAMLFLAHIPLSLIIREMTVSPVAILLLDFGILIVYSTIFITRRGQTPGKIMLTLRVISAGGGPVTQRQAAIRALAKWTPVFSVLILMAALSPTPTDPQAFLNPGNEIVSAAPPASTAASVVSLLGLLLAIVLMLLARLHPDRQALHDRIAGTYLIRLHY